MIVGAGFLCVFVSLWFLVIRYGNYETQYLVQTADAGLGHAAADGAGNFFDVAPVGHAAAEIQHGTRLQIKPPVCRPLEFSQHLDGYGFVMNRGEELIERSNS